MWFANEPGSGSNRDLTRLMQPVGRAANKAWPADDSLPCTAAVRALGVPLGVFDRRKDCIVTTPEARPG